MKKAGMRYMMITASFVFNHLNGDDIIVVKQTQLIKPCRLVYIIIVYLQYRVDVADYVDWGIAKR